MHPWLHSWRQFMRAHTLCTRSYFCTLVSRSIFLFWPDFPFPFLFVFATRCEAPQVFRVCGCHIPLPLNGLGVMPLILHGIKKKSEIHETLSRQFWHGGAVKTQQYCRNILFSHSSRWFLLLKATAPLPIIQMTGASEWNKLN